VCTRAELCLAAGLPDQTLELVESLVASAANMTEDRVILRASILRGRALAMLERWAEAEAEFRLALRAAEAAQVLPSLWRIRTHLARLYTAQTRRQEADQEAGVAHELIGVLSSRLPEGNLRETFARSAVATLRGARSAPGPRSGQSNFGGLTNRERQVALLVAAGKSNREIADQLVLGERTIETHVSNILAKLGFASRAQIAAWSVEVGLRAEE
jgi:DNA-binding CsgD family transcriptional regulator